MSDLIKNKITINNFSVIKQAEIEIKDVNILIGPQSNGKSLVAKLIYFFNGIGPRILISFGKGEDRFKTQESLINRFRLLFPEYLWSDSSFEIVFWIGNVQMEVNYKKGGIGIPKLELIISNNLWKSLIKLQHAEDVSAATTLLSQLLAADTRAAITKLINDEHPGFLGEFTFIPAGRSSLSMLQDNIFTLLSADAKIDPFVQEYGAVLARTKITFSDKFPIDYKFRYFRLLKSILNGQYAYVQSTQEDWIISESGRRTKLTDSSSGQQEVLPLIATLLVEATNIKSKNASGMIFIEEPEAHLFPTTQSELVSMMSSCYSELGARLFITSHSPYIVSAFNNLIMANDVIRDGKITEAEFSKMNGGGGSIPLERLSAYTLEDGISTSIIDEEYRMIGAYTLDDISSHFQDIQNKLLMLGNNDV